MALSDDIVKVLSDFGLETKTDLQQSLRDKGVKFGGQDSKLSNRIKFEVKQSGTSIVFQLSLPDYYEYVDKGRRSGGVSKTGQESVSNWIKRKGLITKFANDNLQTRLKKQSENKSDRKKKVLKKQPFEKSLKALTYLISRKLKAKGFTGNNFFTDVIKDGRVEELKAKLSKITKTNIEIQIKELTQ